MLHANPKILPTPSKAGARLVVALVGLMALLKLAAVVAFTPKGETIFNLGFSFDPYVKSLLEGRGFVSCLAGGCDVSMRMPALPFFMVAMAQLTTSLMVASAIKAVLLSLLVYAGIRGIDKFLVVQRPLQAWIYALIGLFLVVSPNLIKHAAAANYEEGYLIELLAINFMGVLMLLAPVSGPPGVLRFLIPVAAACLGYLFKSSQILVLVVTVAFVVGVAVQARRFMLAGVVLTLAALGPCLWLAHNYTAGGRATIMSSFDGENLYRGFNARTLAVYPHCNLDMLFEKAGTCDGKPIAGTYEASRDSFADEWTWNDFYKQKAMDWIVQNPGLAARTLAVKFATFFAHPGLVPEVATFATAHGQMEKPRSWAETIIGSAWIIPARLIEMGVLLASGFLLVRGDRAAKATALACLGFIGAYSAPYVLGFGHERHFVLMLMLCVLAALFLFSTFVRRGAGPHQAQ